jgi:hypothetical protein
MRHPTFNSVFIFLSVILLATDAKAQRLDEVTNSIAQSLLQHEVDTVLIYRPYRGPMIFKATDTSTIEDISYIITNKTNILTIERLTYEWVYNGGLVLTHTFIQKIDTFGIFKYLQNNFHSIVSDTLLPGLIKDTYNNKDTLISTKGYHPHYIELIIKTRLGTFTNGMIDSDLDDGIIRNVDGTFRTRMESINYEHNISTSIYKMFSKLQTLERELQRIYEY